MSNYESLMFLKEHIFYFNNISDEDFNRLLILENNDFIFDINYMYKATPLLKQIAEYAAISCVLSNTEKDIIDLLLENQNEELLSNTLDFTDCCYFYMSKLIDNHCSHPSVTNLKCIEYINKLYEDIMDSFVEVIENLPNQLLEPEFFNLFSSVDDRVCDNIDISFRKIILKLDEYSINTSKQLLIELKRYITDIFSNKALLNNVASYSSLDNNMIFCLILLK